MFILITTLLIVCFIVFYIFVKVKHCYWKKLGVPHSEPSFVLGNYSDYILQRKSLTENTTQLCRQYPQEPYVGAFIGTEPVILIKDLDLIKTVTTKDFYYFNGRELSQHIEKEILFKNIFSQYGDNWKVSRQNLTPLFTSAKMKNMFQLIKKCNFVFEKLMQEEIGAGNEIEIRVFMSRYTMDCIGTCAFGIDTKAMGKDDNKNPFRNISDKIFEPTIERAARVVVRSIWPSIFYGLGFKVLPSDIADFFSKLLLGVFDQRDYKPTTRNDFVDLVLNFKSKNYLEGDGIKNLKNESTNKIRIELTDELLVSQCFLFFAAGFETSATTLSFTIYELAKNKEAQMRVIDEIDAYIQKKNGDLNYDCVTELPFTEACIDEALRLYPVLGMIPREVMENYQLPSGVVLKKGLRVFLPVEYIHMNPDNFPEPQCFKPERFLHENKQNLRPFSYFPFGEGPRVCIGMRFAKMQMLAGLVTLFKGYTVDMCAETPRTMQFEPKSQIIMSKTPIKLMMRPRDNAVMY